MLIAGAWGNEISTMIPASHPREISLSLSLPLPFMFQLGEISLLKHTTHNLLFATVWNRKLIQIQRLKSKKMKQSNNIQTETQSKALTASSYTACPPVHLKWTSEKVQLITDHFTFVSETKFPTPGPYTSHYIFDPPPLNVHYSLSCNDRATHTLRDQHMSSWPVHPRDNPPPHPTPITTNK